MIKPIPAFVLFLPTMDETDSKELENKPTETEEADIKPLTARQTKLISYLSSEATESNDMLDRKNLHALNEIATNPLAGDQVPTIHEADLAKYVNRKTPKFGTRSSLKGFTFASQKIKTEPGATNVESIQKSMDEEKLKKIDKKSAHDAKRKSKSDKLVNLTGSPKTKSDKKVEVNFEKKVEKKVIDKKQVAKKRDRIAILSKKREENQKRGTRGNSTSKKTQMNNAGDKRKLVDAMYRQTESKPYYRDSASTSVDQNQQQQPSFYRGPPQNFPQQQFSQSFGLNMQHDMQQHYQNMQNVPPQSWNQFSAQQQNPWSSGQNMSAPQPVQYQAPNQWASAGYANGNVGWSNSHAPPPAKTSRKSGAGW